MIQVKREPPKCKNCQKVLEWLPWKNGKPQRPVDPTTKQPCECWKTKGGGASEEFGKGGRIFDKADKYRQCPYCAGWYNIDDGNEEHERTYHKDKKIHMGQINIGDQCFTDEILYHGRDEYWFNDFISVDGKENVREFAKKHGIKVIRDESLL